MIEEKTGFIDNAFDTLLDGYQMFDWNMPWKDFIEEARREINLSIDEWRNYPIGEED